MVGRGGGATTPHHPAFPPRPGPGEPALRYHLKHSAHWAALRWLLARRGVGDYQQYNLRGQVGSWRAKTG